MSLTGNILGVVGVKVSMKNVQQTDRLNVVKAAYRKLQKESGEPEPDVEGFSTLQLQEDDISKTIGTADTQHHMQPCFIAVQDNMLKIIISGFQVLRMPLGSLAVAMQVPQNPCRFVCLGKTEACLFQLGQDTERVALFVQMESTDEVDQILNVISDQTMAMSNLPKQQPTNTSVPPKGEATPVMTPSKQVPEPHISTVGRGPSQNESQIESQRPPAVRPRETLSEPVERPKLPPKPALKTHQRPHSQLYENVPGLKTVVSDELGMKLKLTGVLLPPFNKQLSESSTGKANSQGLKVLSRSQSYTPTNEILETLTTPPTQTVKSMFIATSASEDRPEQKTRKISQNLHAPSSISEEEQSDELVTSKARDCDAVNHQNKQNDENPYVLTSNFKPISEENAETRLSQNNLENAGYLPERPGAQGHARIPSLSDCSERESKIILDLLENEKRYITALQELQNVFAASAPGSDFHRVIEKLNKFHGLIFCPTLQKVTKDFKRELAEAFTKNCDSFKIYEELLMIHYRFSKSENMGNYADKLIMSLSQLQKYKRALSALDDGDHDDKPVMQEAKAVIDGPLVRADNYLLLDSITELPFTPDQCRSLLHKGTMKIKNKYLSRSKEHLVVLLETHLIIAEKSSSQKKNRYSGCIRMDTLIFEGQAENSFTVKGILQPGSGKQTKFTFTAQSSEVASNWVTAIRQVLEKRDGTTLT